MMAHLSNVYQTPWMGWGFVIDPQFALSDKFPFVTTLTPTSQTIGVSAVRVLAEFNWDIVSVLYSTSVVRFCVDIIDSFVVRLFCY
ncbi:unnamed protein product [Nippostrongylus brasiliensis]|uniref:ANF_receptor domain-containing protein n=1 Tax=Nippostrongylus brasiliensis TaxID=27835 RepID=A0A0N4Y7F5_NIPBR|nr:unnamed protein product [Nippostrongylus brasiliensis]